MTPHLTEEQMCRAIAGQATLDEQRHAGACELCRDEIESMRAMLGAFRSVVHAKAERRAQSEAPSLAAGRQSIAWPGWALAAAGAAGVAAALVVPLSRQQTDTSPSGEDPSHVSAASEFLPLTYSTVPVSDSHVVRLEVPAEALEAFGLEPVTGSSGGPDMVLADVVVGEDGLARAVRFVTFANDSRKERLP